MLQERLLSYGEIFDRALTIFIGTLPQTIPVASVLNVIPIRAIQGAVFAFDIERRLSARV